MKPIVRQPKIRLTAEWAQLDLQSIQHRDYFGHLSIFMYIQDLFNPNQKKKLKGNKLVDNSKNLNSV